MSARYEHRTTRASVRSHGGRTFTCRALVYDTLDDHGTTFAPGCFTASLADRMPRVCWAHDWSMPVGQYVGVVRDDGYCLELRGELDDFEAVPLAKQCAAQLASGTIDQFSVGFYRTAPLQPHPSLPGVAVITRGELVEVSPVLLASVPGTALLAASREGSASLDREIDAAIEMAHRRIGNRRLSPLVTARKPASAVIRELDEAIGAVRSWG